jgi:hypothetical protein
VHIICNVLNDFVWLGWALRGEVRRGPSKKRKLREVHAEERKIKRVQGLLASEEAFLRVNKVEQPLPVQVSWQKGEHEAHM